MTFASEKRTRLPIAMAQNDIVASLCESKNSPRCGYILCFGQSSGRMLPFSRKSASCTRNALGTTFYACSCAFVILLEHLVSHASRQLSKRKKKSYLEAHFRNQLSIAQKHILETFVFQANGIQCS